MVNVDPGAIRALGANIEQHLGPALDRVAAMLQETRGIEHSNFTSVVPALAVAYVAAVEYVEEDLKSRREDVPEIRSRLDKTAANWETADQFSTITPK